MPLKIFESRHQDVVALGDRIRSIRKSLKMTQKAFAASLGIVQGFLCAIEKGKKSPSDTLLIALKNLYGINSVWLERGEGDVYASNSVAGTSIAGMSLIPLLAVPPNSLSSINAVTHISLPDAPPDAFAFRYSGDFMAPTVRDGDVVIIDPHGMPSHGDIILIVGQWGDAVLRRYRLRGGEVFCSADNSSYATFRLHDDVSILGTVYHVWRRVKF